MSAYIFQGNPDHFDVFGYLILAQQKEEPIRWLVNQHAKEIAIGDYIFIWASKGKQNNKNSGVVALAQVISDVQMLPDDQLSEKLWRNGGDKKLRQRVDLRLLSVNADSRRVLRRDWMVEDPILAALPILKMPQATNYRISNPEAARLAALIETTGMPWSKDESKLALSLYNQCYGEGVSKKPSSGVAKLALRIGRPVSGVYNKLMNFRSLDPRDERVGLSNVSQTDKEV